MKFNLSQIYIAVEGVTGSGKNLLAQKLSEKLNSFGFLLDSPILNIDNAQDNKKFGKINLLEDCSLAENIFSLIKNINGSSIKKETATCLLSGLIFYTDNFKNKLTAGIFETAADLMKKGAELPHIINNIKQS